MDNRNRAVVVLFRGDPRREERQKRLPRWFLSTLHVAILKTIGEVAGVDVLIARDVGNDFRLGDSSWQLDSLAERIQAAVTYASMLQRLVAIAELPQPNTNAALAFSSTFRGPPRSHRPR